MKSNIQLSYVGITFHKRWNKDPVLKQPVWLMESIRDPRFFRAQKKPLFPVLRDPQTLKDQKTTEKSLKIPMNQKSIHHFFGPGRFPQKPMV